MPQEPDNRASTNGLIPGLPIFIVGALLWLLTAGFGFFIALPVMFLGSFLMVFGCAVVGHSTRSAHWLSWSIALASVCACFRFLF